MPHPAARNRSLFMSAAIIAAALFGVAPVQAADPAEAKTIGRVVRERQDLSSFLQVLEKSAIGSRLTEQTGARFTVFAPTNEAFKALPKGALETLLDPRNDDRLEEVFAFHVHDGLRPPILLEKYAALRMSTGQFISIDYKAGTIGGARFVAKAIPCSNGIIYLIDQLLTPTTDDLFQRLQKDGRFTIFTRAITASRQGKLFQNMHGLYTTFAPTDDAFKKLPPEVLDSLFRPENDERLEDIIKHHIAEGVFAAGKIPEFRSLGVSNVTPISAFGQQLNFKVRDGRATVDRAGVNQADLPCANGIVHVIDSVILPADNSLLDQLKGDKRFTTLVSLLEETGLDIPVASSSQFTIFAPVNEAWEVEPYASMVKNPTGATRERLFGILARHVITGKHVSENSLPYNKLRTIHDAPIYLTQDEDGARISGIKIIESDTETFNGLINAIGAVISDQMELPESDISTVDAILFLQQSLTQGSDLYGKGQYEASWRLYIRRGYEFTSKYRNLLQQNELAAFEGSIQDFQPVAQFATEAWAIRNAYRNLLRILEQREDRLLDSYLMQRPELKRFGR